MLHFAYGSNMDRQGMQRRCPDAVAIGPARLDHWRYFVMREGYASIAPAPGEVVHGVLWRLSPRDVAAVNAYESIDSGLYQRRMLTVRHDGRNQRALVYVARERRQGRPKPGYHELVVAAARAWELPADYIADLARFGVTRSPGLRAVQRAAETGEIA
jgi:gamma-glutamylcyclotransferase (GGCT)/AIG2-like uncharacterized protein YtfP